MNLQFLINVVDFGMDIQEAIDAPCFQILDFPSSFYPRRFSPGAMLVENRIDSAVIEKLQAMGHRTNPAGDWALGDTTALLVDPKRGMLFGAASPRREKSYALAW